MSSLAVVLAWKFDNAPGIRTRENAQGDMLVFDWPAALGAKPTAAMIATWTAMFDALPAPHMVDEEFDKSKALLGLARLLAKDRGMTEQQFRSVIKAELL